MGGDGGDRPVEIPLDDVLVWLAGGIVVGMAGAAFLTLLRRVRGSDGEAPPPRAPSNDSSSEEGEESTGPR